MKKVYGYCRCSTNDTKQDINRQIRELKEMGATAETIYKEYITGTAPTKIELEKLLAVIGAGDTLVVTEISRLSRSTLQLCALIETVQAKKIRLEVKNSITIDCTNGTVDPMTKAFIQMSGVFAELEKSMLSERVKSGLKNARANGKQIGRPQKQAEDIPQKVREWAERYSKGEITKVDCAKVCGISRPTLDKYLKMLEID